jgi:glycosyltransferase involved in cell wall biosynthesis
MLRAPTFVYNSIKLYKKFNKPTYIILYATEYVAWLYVLPTYILSKILKNFLPMKSLLIHDFVDLYLEVYKYSRAERFLHSIIETLSIKISDVFLSSSIIISHYLKYRGIKDDKIIYFPPLASRTFYDLARNKKESFDNKIKFVYVGNLVKELSSIDLLLEAIAGLSEEEKKKIKLHLVLLVDENNIAELDMMYCLLKKYKLETMVKVEINKPLKHVAKVISQSDIGLALLNPSSYLTKQLDFPLKVSEYLCAGIPLIYTNFGNVSMFLKSGVHGWLVEYNKEKFKELFKYLIANPHIVKSMKRNVERVSTNFCLPIVANTLFRKIFKKMIS